MGVDANDGALGDAQGARVGRALDVADDGDGHVVLVARVGLGLGPDVHGVVVADDLTGNGGAVTAQDGAGLALDACVVDATELTDAQGAVLVEATDDEADGVQVGAHADALLGALAWDAHVGRGLVVGVHLVAKLGQGVKEPGVDLRVVANGTVDLDALAKHAGEVLGVDLLKLKVHWKSP